MRSLWTLILALAALPGFTQSRERYTVKSGEIPDKVLPAEAVYYFPEFRKGEANFKTGGKSTQLFNYNYLLDELQFLAAGGDTLAIAEPHEIRMIQIDSVIFYFDKGYLLEIGTQNGYKIAVRERLIQTDAKKEAAYGSTSGTAAITSMENIGIGNNVFKLEVKQEVLFAKRHAFYIGDRYNRFSRANKKGFAFLFPEKKKLIETFIKEHNTDFDNPGDLQKLLKACTQ